MTEKIVVQVYTHPTCLTCPQAIRLTQEVAAHHADIDLQFMSLASERGRRRAAALNILSVPTILVGVQQKRFVGVPTRTELIEAIEQARGR
jgi:thiol-disulfide isomerase/thioredoxin